MYGLFNRAIEKFVIETYGNALWRDVTAHTESGIRNFEALLSYEAETTVDLFASLARALKRSQGEVLEDLGTFLVTHSDLDPVRRLMRFGGDTFSDFIHSLEELEARARMALPELQLPRIDVRESTEGCFTLTCSCEVPGGGHILTGVLRAMADDYGAFVFLEHMGERDGIETLNVRLLDKNFASGRAFELVATGDDV